MNTVIMSAYGEGGSFRTALDKLGADTETAIDTMITYGYQNSERAKQIAQELAGMDINTDEYKRLVAELASLTGEMSSFENATSDFTYKMNALQGEIDYSKIFLEDGSVDVEVLKNYLNQASEALEDYENSLDTAGQEVSRYWQEIYNSATATEEQKAIAKANLDYIPKAIESMKKDADDKVAGFTSMMQNDFISRTGQIIEEAEQEYRSKNPLGKAFKALFTIETEGLYVQDAIYKHRENVNKLSDAIDETFGDLTKDGSQKAKESMDEIYMNLFGTETTFENYAIQTGPVVNKNYKKIIENGTSGISEYARGKFELIGNDSVKGFEDGVTDKLTNAANAGASIGSAALEGARKELDSHSPSREAKKIGKQFTEGFNIGIEDGKPSALTTSSSYVGSVLEKFRESVSNFAGIGLTLSDNFKSGISSGKRGAEAEAGLYMGSIAETMRSSTNQFLEIGYQISEGINNGIKSKKTELEKTIGSIANSITTGMKIALDIHSPSKKMAEIGDYTMQGFKEGMENLYQPILNSVKTLGHDVTVAPMQSLESLYGSYGYKSTAYEPHYDIAGLQGTGYNRESAETNALLRELISAVRAGKTIIIDGDEVGKTAVKYIQGEERRLQKSIVGTY